MKSRRVVSRSENVKQSPLGLNGEDEVRMLLRTAWTSEDAVVYSLDLPPWSTERVVTIHQVTIHQVTIHQVTGGIPPGR